MFLKRSITYSILTLIALGGFFGNVDIENQSINTISNINITITGNNTFAACSNDPTSADYCNESDKASDAGTKKDPTGTDATKWANNTVEFLNFLLGIVTLAASPAILFAGWLMSPDWTSGDLFGLRTPMYTLWVTVSNIVYFVYAILLILIALGTMFGQDKFSYKVMLPKLALGIIMVPFTWWFVQWTISISAVVTSSVITIPMESISMDKNGWMSKPSIPTKITINEEETGKGKTQTTKCGETADDNCTSPTIFLRDQSGMYGYMMVYAYSVFKLDKVKDLSFSIDSVKNVGGVLNQLVLGMLMFLVFGLLTLALVSMLLVRAIKLWVYAIFSPLFTFQFVAGSAMMGGDKDTFTIKEFVGLCFVPAVVGLTLSFGLILINAISSDTPPAQKTCTNIETGCSIVKLMGSDKNQISRKVTQVGDTGKYTTTNSMIWGPMTIDFVGKAGAGEGPAKATETVNGATSVLNSTGGIFGTLIIDIIALVFIWMAFMAAKNVSKAVSMAVEPFEKIGKQVGSLAQSIPKYTPIPGLGMSMSGVDKGIGKMEQGFKDNRTNQDAASPLGKLMGLEAAARHETVKAIENIKSQNASSLTDEHVKNAIIQAGQEAPENKKNKTTEIVNEVIGKFATPDDKGKLNAKESSELISRLKAMNIDDSKAKELIHKYNETGAINKKFWEDGKGNLIYKDIHKNEGIIGGNAAKPIPPTNINITLGGKEIQIQDADKGDAQKIIDLIKQSIGDTKVSSGNIDMALKDKVNSEILEKVKAGIK